MHRGKLVSGAMGVLWMLASGAVLAEDPARTQAKANADARLEGVIEARLEQQEVLVGRGIDATVNGKQVTLTGSVRTESDKALAERVALVQGVTKVDNQLVVAPMAHDEPVQVAKPPTELGEQSTRRALSDPHRRDPLVGSMPFESTPLRETRLRTMGMEDPKLEKQRQEAARARQQREGNTMTPTATPATNSDHPETGNQSAPPK